MRLLVESILKRLTAAGIPYCLLRNRDLIPWGLLEWSDLDIMVPKDITLDRLIDVLGDLLPAQIVPFRRGLTYVFFHVDNMFLRVDLFHGEDGWLGAAYTNTDDLLRHRWNDRGVMVASPLHQAYLTWCNRLLRGGTLPERYHGIITEAMYNHPEDFHRLLEERVGSELAHELTAIATSGRLADTPAYSSRFRLALMRQAFHTPLVTLRSFSGHALHGLLRRIHPAGLDIVIVGPDEDVVASLCSAFAHASSRPVPGSFVEYTPSRMKPAHPTRQPLGSRMERSARGSSTSVAPAQTVRLLRSLQKGWTNWLLHDRGKRARMGFIFRDAHVLQSLIERQPGPDQTRTTAQTWVARLFPKPDLLIVLEGRSDMPHKTVDTAKSDEWKRQLVAYRRFTEIFPHTRFVNETQPLERIFNDIVGVIAEFTRSRLD